MSKTFNELKRNYNGFCQSILYHEKAIALAMKIKRDETYSILVKFSTQLQAERVIENG